MKPLSRLSRLRPSAPYICSNCLLSRTVKSVAPLSRSYATTSPASSGFALLSTRRLISLSGPDSTHYLQGVITANLSPLLSRSKGFYAAFLNAQGRLLNDVFIYPDPSAVYKGKEEGGWLIEVDAEEVERLAKHIKRYRLRSKFDVRVLGEGERGVWSVWREDGSESWTAHSLSSSATMATSTSPSSQEISCPDSRAPGMGRRILLPGDQKPEADAEMEESDELTYRIRRYMKGVPEGQGELLREAALPQESNIDFMGGIDYRKGCYVGQELTIRTHHTGVVRKRVLPCMLYGEGENMPEEMEYREGEVRGAGVDASAIPRETSIGRVEKRGRSAGKWLAGVGNIGLGLCRLEIMTGLQVGGEVGGYSAGDEFKLEWKVEGEEGRMAKVKAFVPSWHLKK